MRGKESIEAMPITPKERRDYQKKMAALLKKSEKLDEKTVKAIQKASDEMRAAIHDRLKQFAVENPDTLSPIQRQQLRAEMTQAVASFRAKATSILQDGLTDMQALGIDVGETAARAIGISITAVQGISPTMAAVALEYGADLIRGISDATLSEINGLLTRGIIGEMSPYDAMKAVDAAMGIGKETGISAKAERIVRTELTRAYGMNSQAGFDGIGGQLSEDEQKLLKKRWVSAKIPGRTRQEHWDADGQEVPYDEPFEVGGEELMYPGDPNGSAGNTINCLCRVELINDELLDYMDEKNKAAGVYGQFSIEVTEE